MPRKPHATPSYKTSAPPKGPTKLVPALFGKNVSERSGHRFKKGHPIPLTLPSGTVGRTSTYNAALGSKRPAALTAGMGLVEGLLVALHGVVEDIFIPDMPAILPTVGKVITRSVSLASTKMPYEWDWSPSSYQLQMGGFFNGPTFYGATTFLAMAWAWQKHGTTSMRTHVDEVMQGWGELLRFAFAEVHAPAPRPLGLVEIETLCKDAGFEEILMYTADAMAVAMQYQPPTLEPITVTTQVGHVLPSSMALTSHHPGHVLLEFGAGAKAVPAAVAPAPEEDEDLDLDESEEPDTPDEVSPGTPAVPPAPAVRTDLIETAAWKQIRRGLAAPGAFFIYGRTANGKTEISAHLAAAEFGYRVVPTDFAPGILPTEVMGTLVPDATGWRWQDGPAIELARAAMAGERVMWQLNELPRSKAEMLDMILIMLEIYSRNRVEALKLPFPVPAGDNFYVWKIWQTGEVLPVPVDNLKIVATANFGDRYRGQAMTDPAFRRRWTAGFYEMPDPTQDEMRKILASRLNLSPTSTILANMTAVFADIDALQAKDASLVMTLNTALLIRWGQRIQSYMKELKMPAKEAFVEAAEDTWTHMICGMKGDLRDPDVARKISQVVTSKASSVK